LPCNPHLITAATPLDTSDGVSISVGRPCSRAVIEKALQQALGLTASFRSKIFDKRWLSVTYSKQLVAPPATIASPPSRDSQRWTRQTLHDAGRLAYQSIRPSYDGAVPTAEAASANRFGSSGCPPASTRVMNAYRCDLPGKNRVHLRDRLAAVCVADPEHRPRIAGLIGQRLNNDDGQAECSFGGMPISRVGDDVANADERVGDGLPDAGCGSWRC
jgi:hypothetical protein